MPVLLDLLRKASANPDPWRVTAGFSDDISDANKELFAEEPTRHPGILREWLRHHQPCLFGKMAAAADYLSFCVITESDLEKGDLNVREQIQKQRTAWKAEATHGTKSGFVIALISRDLAYATPGDATLALARRLLELYLLHSVVYPDTIYLDSVELEQPGRPPHAWQWDVGVNYFSAHGDRRWWHDHRIPGGIAFSMNSVGHMVRSDRLAHALRQLGVSLETTQEVDFSKVDSLGKALILAMRTINNAHKGSGGPATRLVSSKDSTPDLKCPIEMPPPLDQYSHCEYRGYYHTDQTLPSVYFDASVVRPSAIQEVELDFTYLFDDRLENPDFLRMGSGVPIRDDGTAVASRPRSKAGKMWPTEREK